jgi:hypothetical protein
LKSKCDSKVQIDIAGYAWWLKNPPPEYDKKITFYIEGITEGFFNSEVFDADPFEEYLEPFDARPLSEHEWAKGVHSDIYCSAPLSNPLDVYVSVHDFLLSVSCPFGPERYLNMGNSGSLEEFVDIASSKSFLLFNGPDAIRQVVAEGLENCGADYNIVYGKDRSEGLICVRLSGSHLICRSAYAVFEDQP